jgi:peptide/nickel transport system permease protein
MSVMDTLLAFPVLPLAVVLAAIFGAGFATALVAIGTAAIPIAARLARDHAATGGAGTGLAAQLAIAAMTLVAAAIATWGAVSFLGFGPAPPTASWGGIAGEGVRYAMRTPWLVAWPVVAIVLAVLPFNLIAAGLRNVSAATSAARGPRLA